MNPNNPAHTGSRGGSGGHDDNRANQLDPNNPGSSQAINLEVMMTTVSSNQLNPNNGKSG